MFNKYLFNFEKRLIILSIFLKLYFKFYIFYIFYLYLFFTATVRRGEKPEAFPRADKADAICLIKKVVLGFLIIRVNY